jgi:disulfide bond formation protein DsbB
MLTKSGHGQPSLRQGTSGFVTKFLNTNDRLCLRPRDALIGTAALVAMVSGVLVIPVAASFGGIGTPLGRVLSIVFLLFPPAILAAVYSLFFEKSKVYGSLGLLLAGIVLLAQPSTWHWLGLYLPFACAFTVFCAVVWVLEHRRKR